MYKAYVTKLKNVRKHSNADKLQLGDCFGNTVVVGLNMKEDDIGIYFPVDGKLGLEFATKNNLLRMKDSLGNNTGGYLDPDKRNIKAIKLRGEKSDGLFLELDCLKDFTDISKLKVGETIDILNGVTICEKYIPRGSRVVNQNNPKAKKRKVPISPLFLEHKDTEQLAYNLNSFKDNDIIEVTLKMHGTSQRTGYLPAFQKYKRSLLDIIFKRSGKPIYEYGYVTGTRRVVLGEIGKETVEVKDGYYSDDFRVQHAKAFENKLHKGETVYYEVVGYTNNGTPIMSTCQNEKNALGADFVKKYGKTTEFSYGCEVGKSKLYVYRMTLTNEDGFVMEYSPTQVRERCEQMGIETVPVLGLFHIKEAEDKNAGEIVKEIADSLYEGVDPIGKTHIREGVVVRVVNSNGLKVFKHKNFEFKVLEGIIKDKAIAPDMEEASGLEEEDLNE